MLDDDLPFAAYVIAAERCRRLCLLKTESACPYFSGVSADEYRPLRFMFEARRACLSPPPTY